MTEVEILAKVATAGWTIVYSQVLNQEGSGTNALTLKCLYITKPQDSVMRWQKVNYFLKVDDTCYWQNHDPFYVEIPIVSFGQKVQNKIAALVAAATIKAGYIEKIDEASQTALVVVVKPDNTFAPYHVYTVGEVLTVTPLTGIYPI